MELEEVLIHVQVHLLAMLGLQLEQGIQKPVQLDQIPAPSHCPRMES